MTMKINNDKRKGSISKLEDALHPLDWRRMDTILKWAAFHDIKNDKELNSQLQEMRKWGGTASLKAFWYNVRLRVDAYNQIINNEIHQRGKKQTKINMICLIIVNTLLWIVLAKVKGGT